MKSWQSSKKLTLIGIIILTLIIFVFDRASAQSSECVLTRSGSVSFIHQPVSLNTALYARVDAYLRSVLHDDGRQHIVIFFSTDAQVNAVLGFPHSWAGYSGMTINNQRWDGCKVSVQGTQRVDTTFIRSGFTRATLFGLLTHELSHASGTADKAATDSSSAEWWESTAVNAYSNYCTAYPRGTRRDSCNALRAILTS